MPIGSILSQIVLTPKLIYFIIVFEINSFLIYIFLYIKILVFKRFNNPAFGKLCKVIETTRKLN